MTFLPYRRSTTFLVGLVVVDLPVLLTVLVAGWFYGYAHTYEQISAYRLQHPWTFAPSLLLAAALINRWRKAR